MKTLISTFVIALVALAGPAFAGDLSKVTTKAECKELGGKWKAVDKACV